MRQTIFLLLFSALVVTQSCSPKLSPFTRKLYENAAFSDENLKQIQFYLSDDLVLTRDIEADGNAEVLGGKIRMENGRKIETIRFNRGTPGVFLFRPDADHFAIAFEEGDDSRYLVFGPNPKMDGRYVLLASEWKNRTGKVTYAAQKFRTDGDAAFTTLLVNLKRVRKFEVENHTAKGRKI